MTRLLGVVHLKSVVPEGVIGHSLCSGMWHVDLDLADKTGHCGRKTLKKPNHEDIIFSFLVLKFLLRINQFILVTYNFFNILFNSYSYSFYIIYTCCSVLLLSLNMESPLNPISRTLITYKLKGVIL